MKCFSSVLILRLLSLHRLRLLLLRELIHSYYLGIVPKIVCPTMHWDCTLKSWTDDMTADCMTKALWSADNLWLAFLPVPHIVDNARRDMHPTLAWYAEATTLCSCGLLPAVVINVSRLFQFPNLSSYTQKYSKTCKQAMRKNSKSRLAQWVHQHQHC